MALDNIRRQRTEAALKEVERRKKVDAENRLSEQKKREYMEWVRPFLPYLIQLEGYFWECASDFSRLSHLPIKSRNRSLLYPLVSTPTIKKPRLVVRLQPPTGRFEDNRIHLWTGHELGFWAYCTDNYSRHHSQSYYGEVSSRFSTQGFNITSARSWLEAQFEKYYLEIEKLK